MDTINNNECRKKDNYLKLKAERMMEEKGSLVGP